MNTIKNFINKGNYSLENYERELLFEKKRGHGWEEDYSVYRKLWIERPLIQEYSEWPLLVDVELSSACNLSCPMCYTITQDFKKKISRKFLPYELFCKIVDEVCKHVPALRLSLRGEATLHPQFLECLNYAKTKGIREVSFLTNFSRFNDSFAEQVVDYGADWITVSIDGLDAKYDAIRMPLKFADTMRKLDKLISYREQRQLQRPVVKIQSIWPAIENNYEEYYAVMSQRSDFVAFNPLVEYDDCDIEHLCVEGFRCPMLFQRLVITSDGNVLACTNDELSEFVIDSIENTSVYEVWNGEVLKKFRDEHSYENGFKKYKHCSNCYLPRMTKDIVYTKKDGSKFLVKKYEK